MTLGEELYGNPDVWNLMMSFRRDMMYTEAHKQRMKKLVLEIDYGYLMFYGNDGHPLTYHKYPFDCSGGHGGGCDCNLD